jgi:hypothetical protein
MKTDLTWRHWLKESKNQALLKKSPSLAQKKFLAEQDNYRQKWNYLRSIWLNSTSLESDSDVLANLGVGYMPIYGDQTVGPLFSVR